MGGSTRVYYFVKELSLRNEITLLTNSRSEIPAESLQEMSSYTDQIITIEMKKIGKQKSKAIWSRFEREIQELAVLNRMKKMVNQLVENNSYDVVLFHGKGAFSAIENFTALPMAIDFCDATSMRIKAEASYANISTRIWMTLRYLQIRRIEKKLIDKSQQLAFISCRDRDAILGSNHNAEVIPNGVDLQYWQRKLNNPHLKRLVFTGVMNYKPNEDAALYLITKILPQLKQSIPDVEVFIVGRDPTPKLCKIAQSYPQVTVTGFVPDMRVYLEQATLFVAPLRYASGMQNKIQEAFAMGVPVITTPIAAEGMVTIQGENPPLITANGASEFNEWIIKLLRDPIERGRLSQAGRYFAKANFDWTRSAEKMEKLCQQAVLSWPTSRTGSASLCKGISEISSE